LQLLNELQVSEDKSVTRVGPGNRWLDVYEYLTPQGLSVIGGRDAEIGVGGLTLGGGISWYSGRHGWACDGVKNYEVVVASGEILEVNQETYPDLYWALRGGGNNFGVVTR
jgi:FAD/FMN-containing dehydrogenase